MLAQLYMCVHVHTHTLSKVNAQNGRIKYLQSNRDFMLSLTLICLKVFKASHSIDNSVFPSYHYFLRDGEMKKKSTSGDFLFLLTI